MNDTKERIQDQVLEMMQTNYIQNIKVKSVVDALNISRSTFYLYYDSIFAVLQDIEDAYFTGLIEIGSHVWDYPLDPLYFTEPHPALLQCLTFVMKHKKLSNILWGPYGDPVFQSMCKSTIRKTFFPSEIASRLFPYDTEMYTNFMVGGHVEIVTKWLRNDHQISPEKLATSMYCVMFSDVVYRLTPHGKLYLKRKEHQTEIK